MTRITDTRIAELLALDEKRTPGEWITGHMRQPDGHALAWIGNHWVDNLNQRGGCVDKYAEPKDDAAFIAAAPEMADALRQLQAEVVGLRKALGHGTPNDAYYNIGGAIIDIERAGGKCDEVSMATLKSVEHQLGKALAGQEG